MRVITESARAKVNLTLHVGRRISEGRFEGYHPLDSLVVFADFGDSLSFYPSDPPKYEIAGEFAEGLAFGDDNLVIQAMQACNMPPHAVTLTKNIPVSAGLGGGSANAAAVLRRFDQAHDVDDVGLGADVPVCRLSQTAYMRGIGEHITSAGGLGQIDAILVNPRKAVSTAAIFKAFDERPRLEEPKPTALEGTLLERAIEGRNDLQSIAAKIEPAIPNILSALETSPHCQLARMSGSGASCFGLYPSESEAHQAAERLSRDYPHWWIKPCKLGDPDE